MEAHAGQRYLKAFVLSALGLLIAGTASAVVTSTADGDWHALGTWDTRVPVAGDAVVINSQVTLTNSSAMLASLTVNSGKGLTFKGWQTILRATNVTVSTGGSMTHIGCTTNTAPDQSRVYRGH